MVAVKVRVYSGGDGGRINMDNTTPFIGARTHQNASLERAFLNRVHCLTNVKLISELLKAVQQHRGATLAYLSGEATFLSLASDQARVIDTLFTTYSLHNSATTSTDTPLEANLSVEAWQVIKFDWRTDELLQNFEFHCHLIDNLKKMMRRHIDDEWQLADPTDTQSTRLLEIVAANLLGLIEELAKLRGLSTNAAVVNACGKDSHNRLSFLVREIPGTTRLLEQVLDELCKECPRAALIKPSKGLVRRLNALLKKITNNILNNRKIREDSAQLFQLVTGIMDAFWTLLAQGLYLVEALLYQSFTTRDEL